MFSRGVRQQGYRPSDKFLRQIDRLERSSLEFPDQLVNLFKGKAFNFAGRLRRDDKRWLIEYLHNVLGTLDPTNPAYGKCLDQLERACFFAGELPRSPTLNISLVPIPNQTPIGPYEICYEGISGHSKVLVKKLKPPLAKEWTRYKKYHIRDVVRWKFLTHTNIVPFLDILDKPIRFVSVWVPGVKLSEYIASSADANLLDLLIGIASGLDYLQSRNIAHGDLGGPNIVVDDSGCPRITDFALDRMFPTDMLREVHRCQRWASPEVLLRHTPWVRIDSFSFAMVIVEVFTGQVPFFPEPDSVALPAVIQGKRPARPTHPDLTDKLWALANRSWDGVPYKRPMSSEILQILRHCRRERMGQDGQIAQPSGGPESTNEHLGGKNDVPLEGGSKSVGILPPVLPPASTDWFSQIMDDILDLTDQVASVALFGTIGVGKSFVARKILDHDRTKATFGDNCYFIHCGDLQNSPEGFIERLSEAVHTDVAQLQSRLESSPPLMLVLDGTDSFLDPLTPDDEEIHAMIEEFGSYEHVCLVTTSRMYPEIRGFHRIRVPTPPEDGARDIFHSLCDLDRSPAVDALIARLDSHLFSIQLLAGIVRENKWDAPTLLKAWGDETSVLKATYYQRLKDVVEPVFHSPAIKELGSMARDVLGAIATFPSGIDERKLDGIFYGSNGVGEVVDVLCKFSLVSRRGGVVRMLSPFQFYFIESMFTTTETGEVIEWGPDCMPAKAWLPVYTEGPPDDWLSKVAPRPSLRRDTGDLFSPTTPVFTRGPPETPRPNTLSRKKWIRRLPKIIKQRLLALFGRRIKPTIIAELSDDPASVSPTVPQDSLRGVPATAHQEDVINVLPSATEREEDITNMPPATLHEDRKDVPPTESQNDLASVQPTVPEGQIQIPAMPGAYDVDW